MRDSFRLRRSTFFSSGWLLLAASLAFAHAPSPTTPGQTVIVDGRGAGRVFDGVGALSSSSSLLLYDYPEPERSQILDYLFKPDYGASLQILKVEIGSDTNSTTCSEPSHMRAPDDMNCHRGIEWWLMKQALARNPQIKFYGLLWGAPGWLKGGLWSADHVRYVIAWLDCAKVNGLHIDYLGGANERYHPPPVASFFIALHKALRQKYPAVKIVATDEHIPPNYWLVATQMKTDEAYREAVNILGEHDVCLWRSTYQYCNASADALQSGKPLWNSEQSSQDADAGPGPLARAMNRNYIDARITGNINWAEIASYYGSTDTGGSGLIVAETPWSGSYEVGKSIWVDAQTTQFAKPGWRYIDTASGYLKSGASYVTLRSPDSGDYTVVIETMDTTAPETVKFQPAGGLSTGRVYLWSTDIASNDSRQWFVRDATPRSGEQGVELTLLPKHVYTFSTTTGQRKGRGAPRKTRSANGAPDAQDGLPLPYHQDFEHIDATRRAPYFQDVAGAFEAGSCGGGRAGNCYRQVITQQPILWHNGGKAPGTLIGDPTWWGDYQVTTDAMLEQPGYAELLGRVELYDPDVLSGYHLRVADTGQWRLYSEDAKGKDSTLAAGAVAFGVNTWHKLGLRFDGTGLVASLDGHVLASISDTRHSTGQIGLAVSPWQRAEFDNVAVTKTREWPRFVPHSRIIATATSSQPGVYKHNIYTADQAIDGRIETRWSSQFKPPLALPQAITLDLGQPYKVYGLVYRPPIDKDRGGIVTGYTISASADGKTFHEVARGTWNANRGTKIAAWARATPARLVRLEATSTSGAGAAASDLNVALSPLAPLSYTATFDPSRPRQIFKGWGTSLAWFANGEGVWRDAGRNSLAAALVSHPANAMSLTKYVIHDGA